MRSPQIHSLLPVHFIRSSVLFALMALLVMGCGGEEASPQVKQVALQPTVPPQTPTVTPIPLSTPVPITITPTPPPPTSTRVPTEVRLIEVDITSLQKFPDLHYTFSGSLPGESSPEVALMDGKPLIAGATQTTGMWVAPVPARFEVTVPPLGEAFQITRVEVTDPGKEKSLHGCEVFIQTPGSDEWKRPPGVMELRIQQAPGMKADEGKSVMAFKPIRATAVRIEIPTGGEGTPDRAFITDIDIIGTAPNGSLH